MIFEQFVISAAGWSRSVRHACGRLVTRVARALFFASAAVGAAALFGCDASSEAAKPSAVLRAAEKPAEVYEVALVKALDAFPSAYEVAGSVAADERVEIASRIPAYIREVAVKEGDAVKKGEALVRLDDAEIEAAVRSAEAQVFAARAASRDAAIDAEKYARLYKDGFISEQDLRKANLKRDASASTLKEAEAFLTQAKNQRRYVVLASPIDGRVAKRLRRAGDMAAPAFPILVIESERAPRFEVHVPETRLADIKPGMRASVEISGRHAVGASVELVGSSADAATRTFLVRLQLDEGAQAAPGEFGRARFKAAEPARPAVPESAVAVRGGVEGVFVVRDGRAAFTWLRLGRRTSDAVGSGDIVEVVAGLKGDELLVDRPSERLSDGDSVRVAEAPSNGASSTSAARP